MSYNQIEIEARAETTNKAARRCIRAYERACEIAKGQGMSVYQREKYGRVAFREVMPHLTDRQSCHDFIACITTGITMEVWRPDEASKLLYAVQLALSLQRIAPNKKMEADNED